MSDPLSLSSAEEQPGGTTSSWPRFQSVRMEAALEKALLEAPRTVARIIPDSSGLPGPAEPERLDASSISNGAHLQGDSSRLPQTGDELFGFRLGAELGKGAFARVFLAEQTSLAGRPVVLKVSGLEGQEPQTLAGLQHTHIVPILSVHEDAQAGVRAMCMPYFGGASLFHVLTHLWGEHAQPTTGKQFIESLGRVAAPDPSSLAHEGRLGTSTVPSAAGQRAWLERLSYIQVTAWVGARLAEALQHAHQRGVYHRDIKPSNVLIGADGQPLLLDFNLAQDADQARKHASLGGTVAYMSPEQLQALEQRTSGMDAQADHRSDIYALGMVLHEMLTGSRPFSQSGSYDPLPVVIENMRAERMQGAPSARAFRPDVPWSLESVLRRCLAPDPQKRYQQAEELAEDLRRFLADLPLRHAPELSLAERAGKWARRHPRLMASAIVGAMAGLVLLGLALVLGAVSGRLARTSGELAVVQAAERKRSFEEGTARALFLINTTTDLQSHLRQGTRVCEEALALYGILGAGEWQEPADWQLLPPAERDRLAEDARELLLLLAGARVRLEPGSSQVLKGALQLLQRGEAIPGLPPCRALWEDRAAYLALLGDTQGARAARERAAEYEPRTARDHYLLGLMHGWARRFDEARKHLDEAVRLDPRHYWSWTQRGVCHQEQGENLLAAADFGVCVGLCPDFAWGYFNRGCALGRAGKRSEAVADFTAALERDPSLSTARVNRGLLYLDLQRDAEALADFDAALAARHDEAFLHSGRAISLERLARVREAEDAFSHAQKRARSAAKDVRLRLLWARGFAISARLPLEARGLFEQVLQEDPGNAQALYGMGMLLGRQRRAEDALGFYNRALEADPTRVPVRRSRAVLLARLGRWRQASQEINLCLHQERRDGQTLYAAACVAALVSRQEGVNAEQARAQAVSFLREALRLGYGQAQLMTDPDLDPIRKDAGFQALQEEMRGKQAPARGRGTREAGHPAGSSA